MSGRVRARGGKGRTGTERERRKSVLVALMTELFDQSFIVLVTCLMMFFESSKTKMQLYDMFHFPVLLFIYLPCFCFFPLLDDVLYLSLSNLFSFSFFLHLLFLQSTPAVNLLHRASWLFVFVILHKSWAICLETWKSKYATHTCLFWQPWKAILMLCLSVICVIDYKIWFKKRVFATFVVNYEWYLYLFCC